MTTHVVSGDTPTSTGARPFGARRALSVLVTIALAAIALAVPPLGSEPAAAATPTLGIELAQSSADSAIGTPLDLTATVTSSGGSSPEPPGGWYVEFAGTADGGWTSGPVHADDGVARYGRTSPVPQTETITARLATAGCGAVTSNTVTHAWWRPEITLTPENVQSRAGTDFTLTGQALRGSVPVADGAVTIVVGDVTGSNSSIPISTTTDTNGNFSATWSSANDAIEFVDVGVTDPDGFSARRVTSHAWTTTTTAGDTLSLTNPASVRVGERVLATAVLTRNGTPVSDPPIEFFSTLGWSGSNTTHPPTDSRYSYAANFTPGWGVAGARAPTTGPASGVANWWAPTLTFVAADSSSAVGGTYGSTVVLSHDGIPMPGVDLSFQVDGEDGASPATTDANGRASISWAEDTAGPRTITVREAGNPTGAAAATTGHTWVDAPSGLGVGVDLTQSSEESRAGSDVQLHRDRHRRRR